MSHTLLGVDIGASSIKLAQVSGGRAVRLTQAPLPEHLIRENRIVSVEALAQELRQLRKTEHFTARDCALVLPPEAAFVRRITVPYMTVDQLKVNLPYEFHDYLQKDKDLYFYDYAVAEVRQDEDGVPRELELLAAAASKETIAQYRGALRKAGLRLVQAVPAVMTYRNLIRSRQSDRTDAPREYCVVDLGHSGIRVHIYRGAVYDTTRAIDFGGAAMDQLIADACSVDPHVAADYKRVNHDNVHGLPVCQDLYSRIAVEIMRAVNFYGFNTPDADLKDLYLSGGLSRVAPLVAEIKSTLELNIHAIDELLPQGSAVGDAPCASAVGAALQSNGR